MLGPRISNLT